MRNLSGQDPEDSWCLSHIFDATGTGERERERRRGGEGEGERKSEKRVPVFKRMMQEGARGWQGEGRKEGTREQRMQVHLPKHVKEQKNAQ